MLYRTRVINHTYGTPTSKQDKDNKIKQNMNQTLITFADFDPWRTAFRLTEHLMIRDSIPMENISFGDSDEGMANRLVEMVFTLVSILSLDWCYSLMGMCVTYNA